MIANMMMTRMRSHPGLIVITGYANGGTGGAGDYDRGCEACDCDYCDEVTRTWDRILSDFFC